MKKKLCAAVALLALAVLPVHGGCGGSNVDASTLPGIDNGTVG